MDTKFKILLVILVLLAVVLVLFFYFGRTSRQVLPSKPNLLGLYLTDPDLLNKNASLGDVYWKNNQAIYISDEYDIGGRKGVIAIHPISVNEGSYIEQSATLPQQTPLKLYIGAADIAGKVNIPTSKYNFTASKCDDVGFIVKLTDVNANKEKILDNFVINAKDGWKDFAYDISGYAGKTVTVRVESYAGGPCGKWVGEWAAVDYVDIY